MIQYRKATPEDVSVLTQMRISMLCDGTDNDEAFREKLRNNTMEYMTDGLINNSFVAWIAVFDGKIIAMSGLTFFILPPNDWCPNGKTAYIGNLYTSADFRKQGIASHLLSLVVKEAKVNGCERILLNTTDMGQPLYEKHGFAFSPTAMAHYPFLAL